jgi:hypothetical protein
VLGLGYLLQNDQNIPKVAQIKQKQPTGCFNQPLAGTTCEAVNAAGVRWCVVTSAFPHGIRELIRSASVLAFALLAYYFSSFSPQYAPGYVYR